MSLKGAVGLSLAIHLGLMMVKPPQDLAPTAQALNKIEVVFEPASRPSLKTTPQMPSQEQVSSLHPILPVKLEAPASKPVSRPRASSDSKSPQISSLQPILTPPVAGASTLSEADFAIFQHKQWVRVHLKKHLTYPTLWLEGSVRLSLTLRADGALTEARIRDASDPRLERAALSGAQQAAPYPAFPPALKESETHYEFWVQYSLQ